MNLRLFLSFALLAAAFPRARAASLRGGEVRQAVNDVRIADQAEHTHPAAAHEILRGDAAILTGTQSRAELRFADHTVVRLGAGTALRLQPGNRDLRLDRGTLLLQIPKLRGGARILVGSLTAAAGSATLLIEHLPGSSVKVVVLEGDLRISVSGFLGDSIVLPPGKMLITKPEVRRIPDPVDVDVGALTRTSSLTNPTLFGGSTDAALAPLASMPLIEQTIARQAALVKDKRLFPTNLTILGSGTTVVIPSAEPAAPDPAPGATGSSSAIVTTERGDGLRPD